MCAPDMSALLPSVKLNSGHWINMSIITYTRESRDAARENMHVFIKQRCVDVNVYDKG